MLLPYSITNSSQPKISIYEMKDCISIFDQILNYDITKNKIFLIFECFESKKGCTEFEKPELILSVCLLASTNL